MGRQTKKDLELEIQLLKQQLDKLSNIEEKTEEISKEIPMNKLIKVTSLYNGILNLKSSNQSDSTVFTFSFLGYTQPLFYSDLIKCINVQRRFFLDGFCYIEDREVIKAHYLENVYQTILNKDGILNFLNNDDKYIVTKYQELPIQQKITVLETIANRLNDNENIDRNKIDILANVSEVDIYELANKLK
jgi:hypothetical protein